MYQNQKEVYKSKTEPVNWQELSRAGEWIYEEKHIIRLCDTLDIVLPNIM